MIISNSSHTRHIKLSERNKVPTVQEQKKNGPYPKFSKYGAFTLLTGVDSRRGTGKIFRVY
jgi:hypothetical protein